MPVISYVLGGLVGLAFGSLTAFLNSRITKRYLKKNSARDDPEGVGAVMGVTALRQIVNVAALAAVYFTRNLVPFPFIATIIGTALGLTAVSMAFIHAVAK
jgi:hypothetical protein